MVMVMQCAHDNLCVSEHTRSIICGEILVKQDYSEDMAQTPVIALLTDFGIQDHYVGVMKGVILGICPHAQIVDITHTIPPQNIHKAAYTLFNAYAYFPDGSIFISVVDPGVGSSRRAIAVQHQGKVFIAPDNGVLTYVLGMNANEHFAAIELTNNKYRLPDLSTTFHGRDIFAPAAAYLASGVVLTGLGSKVKKITQLPLPECEIADDMITGRVWDVDTFGNIITSIGRLNWIDEFTLSLQPVFGALSKPIILDARKLTITIAGQVARLVKTYASMPKGELGALVGSEGFLEIALRDDHAAHHLSVKVGNLVQIQSKAF